ncbi:MAG TPA: hypothetical protein PJ986_11140 [Gammaproteobacteria bacterium]|nr:hypothetical protein [Gammaproteobacteria bacterium]
MNAPLKPGVDAAPARYTLEAQALRGIELTPDGARISLVGESADGARVALSLPSEVLQQLVMSLPRVARLALQRRHGDPSLRLVYPLGDWTLEAGADASVPLIVNLATADGFEVSFAASAAALHALGAAVCRAAQRDEAEDLLAPAPQAPRFDA